MDLEFFNNIDVSNKYSIIPKVVVYKNLFCKNYLKEIVDILKKDENQYQKNILKMREEFDYVLLNSLITDNHGFEPQENDDDNPLSSWVPWYTFGSKTVFNHKKIPNNYNFDNENYEKLNEFKNKIELVLYKIYLDYINDWKDSEYWPIHLKNWNLHGLSYTHFNDEQSELAFGTIEILKHDIFPIGQAPDGEFTIKYHTDSNESRWDEPRSQQFITMTFYLNDDYEGGEVDFINEKDKKLVSYKPECGDITVFPSGIPYWHAAKQVISGENKFFIRVFICWNNPGSKKWHDGVKKYGYDKWHENYLEEAIENQHTVLRQIIKKDSNFLKLNVDENGKLKSIPLYVEEEIYLDSKKINK